MWQSLEILNVFNTLTLKQILWKTQTLLEKLDYRFLVENVKIENGLLPCKAALSDGNLKTNRMGSTKWNCHEEWNLASNYFIFFEKLVYV